VLVARLIVPVVGSIVNPAGALNVPPGVNPAPKVGVGFGPVAQTGLEYEKLVTGTTLAKVLAIWTAIIGPLQPATDEVITA
jgi:hypothetical protein